MSSDTRAERIHELDVTLWVGKNGIDAVTDELEAQLDDRELVKIRFHRSALAGTDTGAQADHLADRVGASVVETRGHTAVMER